MLLLLLLLGSTRERRRPQETPGGLEVSVTLVAGKVHNYAGVADSRSIRAGTSIDE